MMKTGAALAFACALTLPADGLAAAEVEIATTGPVVELHVFENVEVTPDIASIGAGVITNAATATQALRKNSEEMQRVIDRIKALGVAKNDIQTTGISVNGQYDYDQANQRPVLRGYQASNRVNVILRNIEQTGQMLDALVEAGANDLTGPSFSIADDQPAKDAARKRAVMRAQAQAKAYAALLGYDDARVVSIAENTAVSGPVIESAMTVRQMVDLAAIPPVQPGMISAGISITITYELVRNQGNAQP